MTAIPPPSLNWNRQVVVREAWLAQVQEAAIDPALPIIDPHHHLWNKAGERYLLEELLEDCGSGHNVLATVFVQCVSMYRPDGPEALRSLGETEFANGLAAQAASGVHGPTLACAGIVGMVDLTLGEALAPVLEAHIARAGPRFRGVRNQTAWHASPEIRSNLVLPPPGPLEHPAFPAGARRLAEFGLSLDVWAYHTQLPAVLALARAAPELTIILDHLGGPVGVGPYAGRRAEVFEAWRRDLRDLATCPNVMVKLGGLGMEVGGFDFHLQDLPPDSAQLAQAWGPYVETAIEAFGCARSMFESNFPVDKGMCGYGVLWNAFKRMTAGASASEMAALFARTAARVYGLEGLAL